MSIVIILLLVWQGAIELDNWERHKRREELCRQTWRRMYQVDQETRGWNI